MARLSREELEQIIAEQMPGHTLVPEPEDSHSMPAIQGLPDAVLPHARALRRKYLGTEERIAGDATTQPGLIAGDVPAGGGPANTTEDDEEHIMVLVQPKHTGETAQRNAGPKIAIISSAKKRIIGMQG